MPRFKIGDRVEIVRCKPNRPETSYKVGLKSIIDWAGGSADSLYSLKDEPYFYWEEECLSLITPESQAETPTPMNIKEKFVLALTKEPQKSFRKAGITNGDDLLTDDGQKIFLSWLLQSKFADEFKTAVVDPLLAEQDKE